MEFMMPGKLQLYQNMTPENHVLMYMISIYVEATSPFKM
jgi:hypothetical protein